MAPALGVQDFLGRYYTGCGNLDRECRNFPKDENGGVLRPVILREGAFWSSLMLPGIDPIAADAAFLALAIARPRALHPKGPPNKPIPVVFDTARDADHIL